MLQQYEFSFKTVLYDVVPVSTIHEGMQKMDTAIHGKKQFDIILIDQEPVTFHTTKIVSHMRRSSLSTPIVVLSFSLDKEMLIQLMRSGCNDFLEKPVGFGELYSRIEDAIQDFPFYVPADETDS